jgi:hypothetical protein
MARSLERRIARLQAQRLAAAPRMLAWQDTGEPGIDADTVQLAGGERLTLDEWHQRYSHGTLIRVVYGEQDEPRRTGTYAVGVFFGVFVMCYSLLK